MNNEPFALYSLSKCECKFLSFSFCFCSSSAVDGVTQKVAEMDVDDQKIHMDIEEQHRLELEQFLKQKKEIGELKALDFQKITELGCGNGGVVWKVLHKPSNVVMARKVFDNLRFTVASILM